MESSASTFQLVGAGCFGAVIGWFAYYLNRYREEIGLQDLATVIAAIGGAAVLALFPAKTDLFAAYAIGLAIGFFGYFLVLLALVAKSDKVSVDWFLSGRGTGEEPNRAMDQLGGLNEPAPPPRRALNDDEAELPRGAPAPTASERERAAGE